MAKPQKGSSFPLVDLPEADIILWQDYKHHEGTLSFTDLLSLFVGEAMALRRPMQGGVTTNRKHRNRAPTFYTGRARVAYRCSDPDPEEEEERTQTTKHCVRLLCCLQSSSSLFGQEGGFSARVATLAPKAATPQRPPSFNPPPLFCEYLRCRHRYQSRP